MTKSVTPLRLCLAVFALTISSFAAASESPAKFPAKIRFIDSATGYAVHLESLTTRMATSSPVQSLATTPTGKTTVNLESGPQVITASSPEYQTMSGEFEMTENNPYTIRFLLDPLVLPPELAPENVIARHRADSTLIQGFVVNDETGEPLADVQIHSAPSGAVTMTDTRGYFQFYLPAQNEAEATTTPANLVFEKSGFQGEERQYLELWPDSDITYRIRLNNGTGKEIVDERLYRRRSAAFQEATKPEEPPIGTAAKSASFDLLSATTTDAVILSTVPANSTVRIPRNIRVLKQDGTNIDYISLETYAKHVLPSEWIAGWGSPTTYPGGSNCLNAGAVAVRCYAINRINAASGTSAYDICATTSCQVYNPANSSSFTDAAINFTAPYVLITAAGAISSTEYSAENNSLGNSCGDGFTEPSTTGPVCIFDPVCSGETRNGHGRGMCQWGSAKWASGRKFTGNSTGNATLNGYPRRDWIWIVQHYYPTLTLVKAAPLVIGDDVKALTSVNINMCPDGGITNGANCTLLATLPTGTTGVIVDGPLQILADGKGFTWYKIQWNDAGNTLGWGKENYIERVFSLPAAPSGLSTTAIGTNQINLMWVNNSGGVEAGFKIERAIASGGPWLQLGTVAAGVTTYADQKLYGGSTWYYRVRAYNAGGNSGYSSVANTSTSNAPPVLAAIANRTITEGTTLSITNTATASDFVQLLTDFEAFVTETSNGVILFRDPTNSPTTTGFLTATPDLAVITDVFNTNGNPSTRALRVNCSFSAVANPWLRLTTASAATFPNPVIDFTKKLRFNLYTDKAIQVGIGCRETTTAAGTAIGANGGTTGGIEWAGVTNMAGTTPMPTRTIASGSWATLTFDFPNEPVTSFSSGNGVLSTASGLGTLEHLAIVPAAGTGAYNIFLDNFAVLTPKTLNYALAPGAPTNATINPGTGIFAWTPHEGQAPSTNSISVIVTDNSSPTRSTTNTFTVVVLETNSAPVLAPIVDFTIHAGMLVAFTNSATDPDFPANVLTYSLDPGAPAGATVSPLTGIFTWLTDQNINGTNSITARVTDNGTPALSDARTFMVVVLPRPAISDASVSGGNVSLTWSAIAGLKYRVQYKENLLDANWTDLPPDITANAATASLTDNSGFSPRFYRIFVVN